MALYGTSQGYPPTSLEHVPPPKQIHDDCDIEHQDHDTEWVGLTNDFVDFQRDERTRGIRERRERQTQLRP